MNTALVSDLTNSDWNGLILNPFSKQTSNKFKDNLRNLEYIVTIFSNQICDETSVTLIKDRCSAYINSLKDGREILAVNKVCAVFFKFSSIRIIFQNNKHLELPSYYKQILSKNSPFFKKCFQTNASEIKLDEIKKDNFAHFLTLAFEVDDITEDSLFKLESCYELAAYFEMSHERFDQILSVTLNDLLQNNHFDFKFICRSLNETHTKQALERYLARIFNYLVNTEWGKAIPSPTKLKFKKFDRFKEHLEYLKQILLLLEIGEDERINNKCLRFLKNLPLDRKLIMTYQACKNRFDLPEAIIQLKEGLFGLPGIYKLSWDRCSTLHEPFNLAGFSYVLFQSFLETLYQRWNSQNLENFPGYYLIAAELKMPKAIKRLDKLTYKMVLQIIKDRDYKRAADVYRSYLNGACESAFSSLVAAFNWALDDLSEVDLELFLNELKNLSSINFKVSPNSLEQLNQILNSSLPLKHLDCSRVGKVSNAEMQKFKQFPHLSTLNLSSCLWLRDEDLEQLYILELTSLNLNYLFNLTHQAMSKFAIHLFYLKELSIHYCLEIKNLDFLQHLPNLENLSMQSLLIKSYLPLRNCSKLHNLDLIDCCYISDQQLEFLPTLKHLESLEISADHLSNAGLKLIAQCKNLKNLKLWSCTNFEDKALYELMLELPALTSLSHDHSFKDQEISLKISEKLSHTSHSQDRLFSQPKQVLQESKKH